MKILRISDETHAYIKKLADIDRRTINGEAEYIIEQHKVNERTPVETPTPKNTNVKILPNGTITKEDPSKPFEYTTTPEKNIVGAEARVDDLFAEVKERKLDTVEMACCQNEYKVCRHWVWDTATGEGYKNVLSGRLMEVE